MNLSENDRDTVAGWVAKSGFRMKRAELTDAGDTLTIEVEGAGPAMHRTASSSYIPTYRAIHKATVIPWGELTASERLILVSSIIYKLRDRRQA